RRGATPNCCARRPRSTRARPSPGPSRTTPRPSRWVSARRTSTGRCAPAPPGTPSAPPTSRVEPVTSPPHAATSAGPGVSAGPGFHDVPPSLLRAAPQGDLWWVMFDASPVACSIVDIASGSLIVNRAYRSLLGIAEGEEITMDHVRRRAHPDEIGELNERFGAMDRGETDRVEMDRRYVRDDGSVIWGHL